MNTNFPNPDKYIHVFVNHKDYLLQFLKKIKKYKNYPNESIIYHSLFEIYLI